MPLLPVFASLENLQQEDFQSKRPFLNKIIWTHFAVPQQTVEQIGTRISRFFESEGLHIPGNKVVEFTAEALKEPLQGRGPHGSSRPQHHRRAVFAGSTGSVLLDWLGGLARSESHCLKHSPLSIPS
jgi:hypothetical protein